MTYLRLNFHRVGTNFLISCLLNYLKEWMENMDPQDHPAQNRNHCKSFSNNHWISTGWSEYREHPKRIDHCWIRIYFQFDLLGYYFLSILSILYLILIFLLEDCYSVGRHCCCFMLCVASRWIIRLFLIFLDVWRFFLKLFFMAILA